MTRREPVFGLVLALLTFVTVAPAFAGPPFVTDDPVPTDYRNWEIYAGVLGEPFLEFNYGAMPNVQVSMSTGIGNFGTQFGIKTRFVQEANGWPQISLYPSVAFPTEAGEHAVPFVPIWMQKSSGAWTVFGGGGVYVNRGPGDRDYTLVGAALERTLTKRLTIGAELYHQSADEIGGTGTTAANIGAIAQIGRYHAILFSAGRGLHGNDAFSGYASYEFALGPGAGGP